MPAVTLKNEPVKNDGDIGIPAITGLINYSKAINIFPESIKPYRSTALAYCASFVSTTIGFPLDTVKTRMQTYKRFDGYVDCIRKTYHNEGLKGFFRGIWAPLVSTSVSKSLSVMLFTKTKPYCYQLLFSGNKSHREPAHPFIRNVPVCFFSGVVAGSGVSLFACPFEFTKIYSQLLKLVQAQSLKESQASKVRNFDQNISTLNTIKQIVKYEGILGLYSGYRLHLLRDGMSTGIYYSIYESVKWSVNQILGLKNNETSQVSILLAGGLSGMCCWALIFPIDTTKSLIQKDIVTNIIRKQQGLNPLPKRVRKIQRFERKLYRGLGISVLRSFIVNMVFFSVFEYTMAHAI